MNSIRIRTTSFALTLEIIHWNCFKGQFVMEVGQHTTLGFLEIGCL